MTANSVKPLYLIINKVNGYIDEHIGNTYLTIVHTDESKDTLKKWKKIKDLIRSINNNSDDYDAVYMKIKFNSDDDLLLRKTLELHNIIMIARSVFHEGNKYYLQIFLDKCLQKLAEHGINVGVL